VEVILKHLTLSKLEITICELIWYTLGKETDFVVIRTGQNAHSFEKQYERANLFLSERRPDLVKEGKRSYFN
jgi:hypothetical protein